MRWFETGGVSTCTAGSLILFALRVVWLPLLISTVAINYGAPGLQAGNFLTLFGALDR
jgi:phospholipid/cholesterol/gamma-HCH transport system permease protein